MTTTQAIYLVAGCALIVLWPIIRVELLLRRCRRERRERLGEQA